MGRSDHDVTKMSTLRLGIGVLMSAMAWITAPFTHLRASRHQFVTTDAGQMMSVGVNFARSPLMQPSAVGLFPVPGELATSTR